MNRRVLGDSEINISPLVFGGNVFGWTVDQTASFELLDAMLAHGINAVDTANFYSKWVPGHAGGESETILGNWLKSRGRRGEVVIATKVGKEMGASCKGLSRSAIERAVEDSLRRLQTDYIDLYQSHEDDPNTPLEETLDAYARLMRQGKVRAIGASHYSSERLSQALQTSREESAALRINAAKIQPIRSG